MGEYNAVLSAGTNAAPAALSAGMKWLAIAISAAFLVLLYVLISRVTGKSPLSLADGADGPRSTSKFQWLLWLVAVLFVYVALVVVRFEQGNYSAVSDLPVNVLVVLGLSATTAVAAKGIKVSQVQSGSVVPGSPGGGLFSGDDSNLDLGKTQMIAFTFVAIGIFLAVFVHQLASDPAVTTLPDIDSSLLVLMGISQGGYVGKKLVATGPPAGAPAAVTPAKPLALAGASATGQNNGTEKDV